MKDSVKTQVIVLFDAGGKLVSTIFGSRREAFKLERIDDQMGMLAVKVTLAEGFDPRRDYLLRQVVKSGRIENQLVFGSMPRWAGGSLQATRCLLDSGDLAMQMLCRHKASGWKDSESRRLNGIKDDGEGCCGK